MKFNRLFTVAASVLPLALAGLVAFPTIAGDKTMLAVGAICRVEVHNETPGGNPHLVIEDGMGTGGFPIATSNPKAQAWFNYGIKLFHAYYHEDAKRAFDNAVAADPRCALCLWGQALSRGPVQNFGVSDDDMKTGLEMAQKAQAKARTAREKLLVAAMIRRDSRAQDAPAQHDFAKDVLAAEKAGPDAPDLRLIAAEAQLSMWRQGDHTIADDTIAIIEPILRDHPDNTAAIHYYIHATERAGHASLALAYAEKLSRLAPKASHLVHMAAHTFFRVGRYQDAAAINAFALQVDADHLTVNATPGRVSSSALYYEHNLNFGMTGSLMSGDRTLALRFADHLPKAYPDMAAQKDDMSFSQARRFIIYARYEPARMLALPEPAADSPQTRSFYHYARGEAFASQGDAKALAAEAGKIIGDDRAMNVARAVLAGRLAVLQRRFSDAAGSFEQAADQEDGFAPESMDPPPWWYPVRRSAAAAWLQAGDFARAAEAAKLSLKAWPNDALALLVLSRAEDGLGQSAEARHAAAAAIGSWEGDLAKVDAAGI